MANLEQSGNTTASFVPGRVIRNGLLVGDELTPPKKRRGNPTWGQMGKPLPIIESQFDKLVRQLELQPSEFDHDPTLVAWVRKNCHKRYVPEWLLDELGLTVDVQLSMDHGMGDVESGLGKRPKEYKGGRKKKAQA